MTLSKIIFSPSDRRNFRLDNVAEEIATFLITYRSKLEDFSSLMRNSSNWTVSNKSYKDKLTKWESFVRGKRGKKRVAYDTMKLTELALKFFESCQNEEELKKLRGLVPEKIMEKIFMKRYEGKKYNMGFGAIVNINSIPVIYDCTHPYITDNDCDGTRKTVDIGVWDGNLGEFAEIKFNPEAFHTKEIKYLRLLADELKKADIDYLIYLISMGNKELIEKKLNQLNIWNDDTKEMFQILGQTEIFSLQEAI